jgi:hypothetical protein
MMGKVLLKKGFIPLTQGNSHADCQRISFVGQYTFGLQKASVAIWDGCQ